MARERFVRWSAVAVVAFAVVAGLWFRCTAVERKYFWLDEVHAALLRAGHSEYDLYALFDGQPRRLADLQQYAKVDPQQPFFDTIEMLARNHPVHPPLYYGLLRAWTQVAGDSIAATRWMSVVFSLSCFPAIYWFSKELFGSRAAAWAAVALWSLSPFEVLYAQEAKQYSMFAATLQFAAAAFLRALRVRSFASWCVYTIAASLALYTHLLFAPILGVFAMFLLLTNVHRLRRRPVWKLLGSFTAATTAAVLTFVPWIAYCFVVGETAGRNIAQNHMSAPQSIAWLLGTWISNLGCIFADLGMPRSIGGYWGRVVLWFAAIGLMVYSFKYLRRRNTPAWLFLGLLTITPPLLLIAPDLVLGGGRSMLVRYWMAASIGIIAAVAGAISLQFAAPDPRRRRFACASAAALLVVGFASCYRSGNADFWWNKVGVVNNHRNGAEEYVCMRHALTIIENSDRPLIITELGKFQECRILSFTYYLNDSKIEWLGSTDPTKVNIPADRTVYLYAAFKTYAHLVKQGWEFEAIEPSTKFVRLKRKAEPLDPKLVEAAATPSSPQRDRSGS